ncbi:MFS transporter [Phenylobacterium aquaticum]|uniref:MFS transporter n=1 Tax=Phenylobacterium aquaticum TaxID=1763816 RepID=UPI0026F1CCA0|nr:MFS transporter [Phenylobacterium aquaticum]
MTDSASPRRSLPKADPDGLIAAVLLAFMATAGLFYVNIMPALVSGLQDGLGFTARDAGLVAALNVYGAAGGAFAAVFVVDRISWKPVALGLLSALIAIDLISTQLTLAPVLMAVRFGHGLVGGFLVGIAFAVIARTKAPDRTFGMLLVVQFGLGGVGLLFLPGLVPRFGTPVLFLALAAFSATAAAMLPFLSDYPPRSRSAEAVAARGLVRWVPLAAALVAVFMFQAANMALSAFVIDLGRAYGLAQPFISATLATANWIGALGSVLVVVIGLRFGRLKPIAFGAVLTVLGALAFLRSDLAGMYVLANIVTSVVWAFVIPYLLGLCAAFDPGGRIATLAGFFSKLGLASGPALGAVLLQETHFPRLVTLAVIGLCLSAAFALVPARALDRST